MVDVRTNLIKNRHTLSEKEYQQERNVLRLSVVSMVVVVVVVVALSIWNFVLTQKLSGIQQAITSASKDMQGLTQASAQQIYLKSRLGLITNFLKSRSLTRESLQRIFSTRIEGTHISGLAYESETVLNVDYSANSTGPLTKLVDYYTADTGYFIQVVSRGITRDKEGKYQVSLALTLPKGDK